MNHDLCFRTVTASRVLLPIFESTAPCHFATCQRLTTPISHLFAFSSLSGLHFPHSSNSQVPTTRNLLPSDFFKLPDFSTTLFLFRPRQHRPPMLCSAPAGKSGSNWLDRLRSIKGIPTGDDLDLDSFLTNNQPSSSDSLHSNMDPTPKRVRNRTRASEISAADAHHQPMSSVLAELFNMGETLIQSSKLSGKKYPRKQTNPKFFVASSLSNSSIDCARKDDNAPATNSFDIDVVETKDENLDCWEVDEEDKEKEKGGNKLLGFTKSEVTVIDTSNPLWKVDKFVFRKNNVWKVREKKGKSKLFAKKKRKGSFGFDNMLSDSQFGSSIRTNRQEFIAPFTQGQNTQYEKGKICSDTQDDLRPPPKKRFPFSRSPRKSDKQNPSVIFIKAIPT